MIRKSEGVGIIIKEYRKALDMIKGAQEALENVNNGLNQATEATLQSGKKLNKILERKH